MTFQSKQEYLAKIKDRYRHAGRKGKARILDEFCAVCGHGRKHAIKLLNSDGRRKKKKPGRPSKYGPEEIRVLENVWLAASRPCSERLVEMLPEWLPAYKKHNGYLDDSISSRLLGIKPRTMYRVLAGVRKKHGSRGFCGTKSGAYLKSNIPLKIRHDEVKEPGYMQADTVAHCGGSMEGSFIWSLTFTDVFSGWTENGAVWNKGQHEVHKLLEKMESRMSFQMKGFHSDNGGEFVNYHLHRYYKNRDIPIEMTRGRPGKGNDNPHVEQKNYTHVRCLLGYQRIDNPDLIKDIDQMFEAANLLQNYFISSMKLTFKERRGSTYHRRHDDVATPYQRLMKSKDITEAQKTHLTETKCNLDPYKLRMLIDSLQSKIFKKLR